MTNDSNLNYILTTLNIKFKALKEYRTNVYMAFYANFMFILITTLFLKILVNNFGILIPWKLNEWIFFIINFEFIHFLSGILWFNCNLKKNLLEGNLNTYLTKPKNVFLQFVFLNIGSIALILGLLYLILFILYLIFIKINLLYFTLTFIFSIIGGIFNVILFQYIISFSFFFKNANMIKDNLLNIQRVTEKHPAVMFPNSFQFIFAFIPLVYYSAYATHFLFGYMKIEQFFILFLQLIFLIFIFSIGLYYNWKIGLKKYEAFG